MKRRRFPAPRRIALAFAACVLAAPFAPANAQENGDGPAAPAPAAAPAPPIFAIRLRDPGATWKEFRARGKTALGDGFERGINLSERDIEPLERFLAELAPGRPLSVVGFPPVAGEHEPMLAMFCVPAKAEGFEERLRAMGVSPVLKAPEAGDARILAPGLPEKGEARVRFDERAKSLLSDKAAREKVLAPPPDSDLSIAISIDALRRTLPERVLSNLVEEIGGRDVERWLRGIEDRPPADGAEAGSILPPLLEIARLAGALGTGIETAEISGRFEKEGASFAVALSFRKGTLPDPGEPPKASKAATLLPGDGTVFASIRIPPNVFDRLAELAQSKPGSDAKDSPAGLLRRLLRALGPDAAFEIRLRGSGIATLAAVSPRDKVFPNADWRELLALEDKLLAEALSMAGPVSIEPKESREDIEDQPCVRREAVFDFERPAEPRRAQPLAALERLFGFYERTFGRVWTDIAGARLATSGRGAGPDIKGMIRRSKAGGKVPEPLSRAWARHGEGVHALLAIPPARALRHSAEIIRKASEGIPEADRALGPFFGAAERFEASASDEPVSFSLSFGRDAATLRAFLPLETLGRIRQAVEESYRAPRAEGDVRIHRAGGRVFHGIDGPIIID